MSSSIRARPPGAKAYKGEDLGNEDLRAQLKALQYEVESFKQEKELTKLRHEKELRDAQARADNDFHKAQVSVIVERMSSESQARE